MRPSLAVEPDDGTLFVTNDGTPFVLARLSHIVKSCLDRAGIGKGGGCHLFRHTCATLMLEGGADIRFIQQLLGHVSLETTQIYTRVSIRQLKAIHTATHPARLHRSTTDTPTNEDAQTEDAREDLLSMLADEAAEENELAFTPP